MLGKKLHVKKNDTVVVIAGKDRSKSGKVVSIHPKKDGVIVEGINVVKRHVKPRGSEQGGILEKEAGILVLPANVGWSDLGTWSSLHEFLSGAGENVAFGDVILSDCRRVLVRTDRGVAAVLGMDDVVVVRSGDAVLVCPRARSEEVKGMLEEVRRRFPALA